MNTIYIYLAARDGAPVRYRWRIEFDNRDREILALQSNLQNGRITIRAFLMAAAHHFDPVELEFGDQDIEVMNRPLNEVRAAFEALLDNPSQSPQKRRYQSTQKWPSQSQQKRPYQSPWLQQKRSTQQQLSLLKILRWFQP
jgi:hypothetical protein